MLKGSALLCRTMGRTPHEPDPLARHQVEALPSYPGCSLQLNFEILSNAPEHIACARIKQP